MIQRIDFQQDTIIGLQLSGKITEEEIKPWATLLDQVSKKSGKLRAYIEYEDVDAVTFNAAIADLKFDITHIDDFEKVALVSDQSWTKLPTMVANLFPKLDAEQFKTSEREQARQWIMSE